MYTIFVEVHRGGQATLELGYEKASYEDTITRLRQFQIRF